MLPIKLATPPKIINSVIFGPMSARNDGAASAVFCKVQRFDKMCARKRSSDG